MAALLDLHPDGTHPVLSGVADLHGVIDRMLAGSAWLRVGSTPGGGGGGTGQPSAGRAEAQAGRGRRQGRHREGRRVHRTGRVACQDHHGVPLRTRPVKSHSPTSSTPGTTPPPSPRHRACLPRARCGDRARHQQFPQGVTGRTPPGRGSDAGRASPPLQPGPAPPGRATGDRGRRTRPDRRRRPRERARSRSEEQAAQDNCSLTLHDNGDGTTTGHFTVPALAASILAKVIDAMTAPRRMRAPGGPTLKERPAGPVVRLAAPPRTRVRRAASSTYPPTTCTPGPRPP